MSKLLEKFLDAARSQEPVTSTEAINKLLQQQDKVVVNKRMFYFKTVIIMSMLSVTFFAGLTWLLHTPANTPVSTPAPPIYTQPIPETGLNKSPSNHQAPLLQPNTTSHSTISLPIDSNTRERNRHPFITNWYEPTPNYPSHEPALSEREFFDEYGNLILNETELARLGLITDGNTLTYLNVVDTITHWTIHTNKPPYPTGRYAFRLTVTTSGDVAVQNRVMDSAQIMSTSRTFWPAFVEDINDADTNVIVAEYISFYPQQGHIFAHEVRGYCIPVKVLTTGTGKNKRPKNHTFVFWFKAEQAFVDALPEGVQKVLSYRMNQPNMAAFTKIRRAYSFIHSQNDATQALDSATIKKLQQRMIRLSPADYKRIHVRLRNEGFTYSGYLQKGNTFKKITLTQKTKGTYTNITSALRLIPSADTSVVLAAHSTFDLGYIHFYYQFPDSVGYSQTQKLSREQFWKECNTLIPIRVKNSWVLWFKPSPYLLDVIKNYNNQP